MNIYVYQIGDKQFGATMAPEFPGGGRVVEVWPVNNQREIEFVARHGSAFGDVTHKVHELADEAKLMLKKNGVYTLEEQQDLFSQNALRAWSNRLKDREEKLKAREQKLTDARNAFDRWRTQRTDELHSMRDRRIKLEQKEQALENWQTLLDSRDLHAGKRECALDIAARQLSQRELEWQRKVDERHKQQENTRRLLHAQSENLVRRELRVDDFMKYLKRHPIRAGLRMIFRRKI